MRTWEFSAQIIPYLQVADTPSDEMLSSGEEFMLHSAFSATAKQK